MSVSAQSESSLAGVGTAVLSADPTELDSDSDDAYVIHGVAIGEGDVTYGKSETKKYWPAETLREAAATLEGQPLVKNHVNNADGKIGSVTKAEYQPGVGVLYEAEIAPHYEQLARDVAAGILEVSPRIYHKPPEKLERDEELGALRVDKGVFDNLSIVADGASPSNTAVFGESPKLSPDAGIVNAATASAGGPEGGEYVTAVLSREAELPDAESVADTLSVTTADVEDETSQPAQMGDAESGMEVGEPDYSEGEWVAWEWQGGEAVGRIETISTDEALSSSGATRDPTEEGEPVYKIEHFDEDAEEFGNMKVAYESNLSEASEPDAVAVMAESGPFQEMEGAPDFEHSPAWEDGEMVQWQVRPSLFGEIDHVDWDRHVVMVDVHDRVDGELYSTGMTVSAAFGDVEEYVPEEAGVDAEEMAKHGYEESEYSDVPDGHIFETKADAEAKAEEMGIEGAHKMPDGMWMPGDTHEAYAEAVEEMASALTGVAEELAGDSHPISWDDTMGGDLDESEIPNEGYEDHYVFAADTKSDSSYPLVDADGNLRRGNVDSAWNLRGDVDDKEMSLESFEELLLHLNEEFDDPPIDPSNAMEADPSEWMDDSEAEEASAGYPDPELVVAELEDTEGSMDELDDVYAEWEDHVNMSASQLEEWREHPCADKASVDTEAVIERNLELLETDKSDWTEDHIADAKRTNSFISRMSDEANKPDEPRDGPHGCPSEWAISLLNWAHNPFDSMPAVPDELQGESENATGTPAVAELEDVPDEYKFSNPGEAVSKAQAMGFGEGNDLAGDDLIHTHGEDDETVFMPGPSHEDLLDELGMADTEAEENASGTQTVAGDVSQTSASTGSDDVDDIDGTPGAESVVAVASLASSGSATLSVATVDSASDPPTSAVTMKELTYDSADEEALAELSEPVVVERDELDDLHAEASRAETVEEELTDLNKTVEELSATTETLEDVDEDALAELREADDPEIVEAEELESQRELIDEVTEIYAEELADHDQTALTAEQLAEKFSPSELKEMYDEHGEAELASGIETEAEPDPKGGAVEAEELESGAGADEPDSESIEEAREVVAEELRSAGWYDQADKMEAGELPVEPYLEE